MRSFYTNCKTAKKGDALVRSIITFLLLFCLVSISSGQTQPTILFPQNFTPATQRIICHDTIALIGNAPAVGEMPEWVLNKGACVFLTDAHNDTVIVKLTSVGGIQFYYSITDGNGQESISDKFVWLNNQSPTTPNAGNDFVSCKDVNVQLTANVPVGYGTWINIQGTGSFSNPGSYQTYVNNLSIGVNKFAWETYTTSCPNRKRDTIIVTNYTPSKAIVTAGTTICGNNYILKANPPSVGSQGIWKGPKGVSIFKPDSSYTDAYNLLPGQNVFTWKTYVDSSYCVDSAKVTVNASQPQTALIFGKTYVDTTLCSNQLLLVADKPTSGTASWALVKGAGTFTNVNKRASSTKDSTIVTNLGVGVDSVTWTIVNPGCGDAKASIRIRNNSVSKPVTVKDSCFLSPFGANLTLQIKNVLKPGDNGSWSAVKAPVPLTSINLQNDLPSHTATFQPSTSGLYRFSFQTINTSNCTNSSTSNYYLITKAVAPNDTCLYLAPGTSSGTFTLKSKSVPKLGTGERGQWKKVSGTATLSSSNDSIVIFSGSSGASQFIYSIWNDSCSTCSTSCVNTDIINVTIAPKAKINTYTTCFLANSLNLSANALGTGETGKWSSSNGIVFPDSTKSGTAANSVKIGKSLAVWTLNSNGCISKDTARLTRVTTPYAGRDTCFKSGISNLNYKVIGNVVAPGETGIWRKAANYPTLNFIPTGSTGTLGDSKSNGVYSFIWDIGANGCPVFSDTVKIGIVTNAQVPTDTFFTVPFSGTVMINGNQPLLASAERGSWYNSLNQLVSSGQNLALASNAPGTYTYRYSISDSLSFCSFSSPISITYLSRASIKKTKLDTCVKSVTSVSLEASKLANGESGEWIVDTTRYPNVVKQLQFSPEKIDLYFVGGKENKYVVYWKTSSSRFSSIDSIRITNLTRPIASGKLCAKDTFLTLGPPASFPVRQPYEKAYWIKKSTGSGTFQGDSLSTIIYSLKPGQIQLANVITDKTSACSDTSNPIVLTTVTKAKAFDTPYLCLSDTFASISAKIPPSTGEKGLWTYKSSSFGTVPVIGDAKSSKTSIYSLGQRRTTLRWTIKNIVDSSCFSSDSVNSRLVVNSKATVGYQDTCIVGSTNVQLRAIKAKPYERQAWLKLPSTDTLSRNERFSFANATLGTNTFTWTIYDTTYKQCSSTATQRATILNRPEVKKAATCLVKSSNTVADTLVSDSRTIKQIWKKDPVFSNDTLKLLSSSPSEVVYRAVFSSPGRRTLIWRDSASAICYADDTIKITVISKAIASIASTCVKDSLDTLRSSPISVKERGKWSVADQSMSVISNNNSSIAFVKFIKQGKAVFTWSVKGEDSTCQNSQTVSAVFLSKAIVTGDSCFYYSPTLSSTIHTPSLIDNESPTWTSPSPSLNFSPLDASSYAVNGFILGPNPATYKITSQHDPTCRDSMKVVFRTLTPSSFSSVSPLLICAQDRTLNVKAATNESISWDLKPSKWKIRNSTKDSISLFKLSNDTTYTLYRQVENENKCSLKDSLKIQNRQLDPIKIVPSSSDIQQISADSFFTCSRFWSLLASNPIKDIGTSDTARWFHPFLQPDTNFNKLEINRQSGMQDSSIRYAVTNMNAAGYYQLTYKVSNGSLCPALTHTITIEKRTGLIGMDDVFRDTVCNSIYKFTEFKRYPKDADAVTWGTTTGIQFFEPGTDRLNDPPNVTVKNLQEGDNRLFYKAIKGGCEGTTNIILIRSVDDYAITIDSSLIKHCEQDNDTLSATVRLTNRSLLTSYWARRVGVSKDTNIISLSSKESAEQKARVVNLTYNQPNKFYFVTKNGECATKLDSVVVYNYSKLSGISAGINVPIVCGTTIAAFGKKPPFAISKWSIDDSIARFDDDTDDSTIIRNLTTRNKLYTLKWAVSNGACHSETSSQFRVADTISTAVILSKKAESLCNIDTLQLDAIPPQYGNGIWSLNGDSLTTDPQYTFKVPAQAKNEIYNFVWTISNSYCKSEDFAKLAYYKMPSKANAGISQSLVTDKTNLAAVPPEVGIGEWKVKKSSAVIANNRDPNSEVTNLNFGDNFFEWIVSNGTCPVSIDPVVISFKDFSIPQGFSPNGDSKNDKFEVKGLENYSGTELLVYNRWGMEVYSSSNYQNSWDGNGLDEDTYYYVMTLVNGRKYTGYVVLKRK